MIKLIVPDSRRQHVALSLQREDHKQILAFR